MANSRKNKRVFFISEAIVRYDRDTPPIEANIINLSHGGIGIYANEPIDGRVLIGIGIKDKAGNKIVETAWGQVVWKKPVGSKHAVGISFEGLNPKDHKNLIAVLAQTMDTQKKDRETMIASALIKPNPEGRPLEAFVINISFGGVCFCLKEPLEGRVQISLVFQVKDLHVTEKVWGRVAWTLPSANGHIVGVSFEGLTPSEHSHLLGFIVQAGSFHNSH